MPEILNYSLEHMPYFRSSLIDYVKSFRTILSDSVRNEVIPDLLIKGTEALRGIPVCMQHASLLLLTLLPLSSDIQAMAIGMDALSYLEAKSSASALINIRIHITV